MIRSLALVTTMAAALGALSGCSQQADDTDRPAGSREFPRAHRPVSPGGDNSVATEVQRDSVNEAKTIMDLAQIAEGMTVADIGAGQGYYTVRLASRVGRAGRVLAQDIDSEALRRLGERVVRERLDNVSIKPGAEDDPRLPPNSFDRVFMVHMYHEVTEPYAFIWRLRPALRQGGRVIVVDLDRPTSQHGIPPDLLFCEFSAVGFRLTQFVRKPELQGYFAQFEASGERPEPGTIKPCRMQGQAARAVAVAR